MESVHQQISNCLKETIGKYYTFEEEELIDVTDKLYNIFNNNKIQQKNICKNITTLNTMKIDNLKQLCNEYGIKTGNLKRNDLIVHIIDYQRGLKNKEECDSDNDNYKNNTNRYIRWRKY